MDDPHASGDPAARGLSVSEYGVTQVESGYHRVADQRGVPYVGQLHQPGSRGETVLEVGRDTDRQPGLAHSARTDQANQTRGRQLPPGLGQLVAAAEETRRLGGQVAGSLSGPGHAPKVLSPAQH